MSKFITILKYVAYFTIMIPLSLLTGFGLGWVCDKIASWLKLD